MWPTGSVISSKANESVAEAGPREETGPTPPRSGPQSLRNTGVARRPGNRWRRALWIFVCLEVGIFLLVVPWSPLWTMNVWVGYYPVLRPYYMNLYARGAISGLGLLNLWLGFREVWEFRMRPAHPLGKG